MDPQVFIISVLASAIASGTIVLYATVGEIFAERAGILNLGIEGMMLVGAVTGFQVALHRGDLALAVLAAGAVGGAMALVHAWLCISLRANQIVSGLALTIFGGGVSAFVGAGLVGRTLPVKFTKVAIPGLSDIPIVGPVLFNHNILVYVSYVLPVLAWMLLMKTRYGLAIRSTGEEPLASEIMGIKVGRVRYLCTVGGGVLAGVSGAYLALAYTPLWVEGMTAGRGWITIALVIFSNWNPLLAFGGAYLFGGLEALQLRLQAVGLDVPVFLLGTIPYVFTIVFLLLIQLKANRSNLPKSLCIPYFRERRD